MNSMKRRKAPEGVRSYSEAHQRRKKWLTAVACMAALVVFCTVYALMMPAAALDKETYCGKAEHTHTEECYESVLTCGLEEGAEHVHDDSCYEQKLICGETEHVHTDACFAEPVTETAAEEHAEMETDANAGTEAAALPDGAQVPENYTEQYTVRDDGNGFAVTVYAPEGAVPDGAALSAELLAEDDAAYAEAEEALAANTDEVQSGDGDTSNTDYGFAAMDIHFTDADGNEVEPNGDVYVVIDAVGLLPEGADPESITVQHHAERDNGEVTVETVADTADETDGVVAAQAAENSGNSGVQAAFEVESFSTFTIQWREDNALTVQIIDGAGHSIGGGYNNIGNMSIQNETSIENIVDAIENQDNEDLLADYTFERAVVAGNAESAISRESEVQCIKRTNGEWQYSTRSVSGSYQNWNEIGSNTLYLIYSENEPVKVYVYVAATGLSDECLELLSIDPDTLDQNGYFPAGEIYLDPSYFEGKSNYDVITAGRPLINSEDDWEELLDALGNMDTSNLADKSNSDVWQYNYDRIDYTGNLNNHVGEYLSQARGDIGYTWGSQHTALFRWHDNPYEREDSKSCPDKEEILVPNSNQTL